MTCPAMSMALAWPALALVLEPMSLETLTSEADVVVRGVVESVTSRDEDRGRIVSDAAVRVHEVIQGKLDTTTVVVTVPGGEVGNRGQLVPGAPRFSPGDEVVLFLRPPAGAGVRQTRVPVGLPQGVFYVTRVGPVPIAAQRFGGVGFGHEAKPRLPISMSLDDLSRAIKAFRQGETPR